MYLHKRMRLRHAAWRQSFIPAVRKLMEWGGAVKEMWLRNLFYSDCRKRPRALQGLCMWWSRAGSAQFKVCPSHWSPISLALIHHCLHLPLSSTPHIHPSITSLSPNGSLALSFKRVQNNTSHHSIKLYVPPFHAPYLSSFDSLLSAGHEKSILKHTLIQPAHFSHCLSDGQRAQGVILLFRHLFISLFLSVGQNAMISCWAGCFKLFLIQLSLMFFPTCTSSTSLEHSSHDLFIHPRIYYVWTCIFNSVFF